MFVGPAHSVLSPSSFLSFWPFPLFCLPNGNTEYTESCFASLALYRVRVRLYFSRVRLYFSTRGPRGGVVILELNQKALIRTNGWPRGTQHSQRFVQTKAFGVDQKSNGQRRRPGPTLQTVHEQLACGLSCVELYCLALHCAWNIFYRMIVMHRCILNETWFAPYGIKLYAIVRESE